MVFLTAARGVTMDCAGCAVHNGSTGIQRPPTAWAVIFYAFENTNHETCKNFKIMKYTH